MRIFVTGSIAYDYIMVFPGRFRDHILPDKMHVLSVSFLVDSLKRRRGGTGGQHRLQPGPPGRAARASWGPWARTSPSTASGSTAQGVDTSGIKVIADEHTASCFINTDLAGQPDHRVLSRRHGPGGDGLAARPGRDARRPGDHRPQRPQGHRPLRGGMHGRGHSLPLRPFDAAPADGPGRARRAAARGPRSWPATTTSSA